MSLNQWIAVAVAEKVGVVETAAEFFKKRAGKATGEELMKFLRTVPKVAPEPLTKIRSNEDTLSRRHAPTKRRSDSQLSHASF